MTTHADPFRVPHTEPRPSAARPARGRSTGQIVGIVVGVVIALGGLMTAGAGGALFAVFGGDGTVTSAHHAFSTQRTALVSEVADIDDTRELFEVIGEPQVRLDVESAGDAFVGVARAADVDRYLTGVPVDQVSDFDIDPFEFDRTPRGGERSPAAPADQTFWVAKASGPDAALNWKVRDGDYRFVVMNADGTPGVHTATAAGLKVPHLSSIAWVLIGSGLVLVVGGATTAFVAARSGRDA